MQSIIDFIVNNKFAIVSFLFFISEALSLVPAISANGVFQAIFGMIKKAYDALKPAA